MPFSLPLQGSDVGFGNMLSDSGACVLGEVSLLPKGEQATQTATNLKKWLGIAERVDLIRLGFAYAIKNELDLTRDNAFGTRGDSNYDSGGLDPDGLMAETVRIY